MKIKYAQKGCSRVSRTRGRWGWGRFGGVVKKGIGKKRWGGEVEGRRGRRRGSVDKFGVNL